MAGRFAPARQLVVTADDFGAAIAVNEAVERAHREGVLTAATGTFADFGGVAAC